MPFSSEKTHSSSKYISPSVGVSRPAIILSVVVLPQPEGPNSETNSPFLISMFRLSTASEPLPNCFVTFTNLIVGIF